MRVVLGEGGGARVGWLHVGMTDTNCDVDGCYDSGDDDVSTESRRCGGLVLWYFERGGRLWERKGSNSVRLTNDLAKPMPM